MKILFTVENYYPKMSGVPNVVKYLAEELVNLKCDVTVVTRNVDNCKSDEIINGVKIKRIDIFYTKIKTFAGAKDEYINFVTNPKWDVIIFECSQCITTDLILPYLHKITAKKILHSHGFSGLTLSAFKKGATIRNTVGNSYNWAKWKIYYATKFKKYVKQFDRTLCLSEMDSSKDYLEKYSKKLSILSNAGEEVFFNLPEAENAINKYAKLKNENYFISIANYQEYKNQIGILEEFFKVKDINYDLVFIGSKENEYYDELVKRYYSLKTKNNLKNVHFLTNVKREDIPYILNGAKLYLVGSKFEEFSISLIECMALGIPFISTNVGNAKLLPGGITINKIDNMANSIDTLLKNNTLYENLSEDGKRYVKENCRIEEVTKKLINIINEI